MPFSITKGIEYDVFDGGPGNFNFQPSPGTATDLGAMGPFGGEGVDDNQFTVGEDVSGSGTIYIGDIEIEGNLYPVITATGDYPIADGGNVFILVPDYLPEPSAFPASFNRIASSTAISSNGFIDIFTLARSTSDPSAFTRTFTL